MLGLHSLTNNGRTVGKWKLRYRLECSLGRGRRKDSKRHKKRAQNQITAMRRRGLHHKETDRSLAPDCVEHIVVCNRVELVEEIIGRLKGCRQANRQPCEFSRTRTPRGRR